MHSPTAIPAICAGLPGGPELEGSVGTKKKLAVAGAAFALAGLTGFAISFATPSHADTPSAFGDRNRQVICNDVGQEPTPHGIWAANSVLLSEQQEYPGLNYGQMQVAIGYAISQNCPQYADIYNAYRSRYP
jgi:hypothetical protein